MAVEVNWDQAASITSASAAVVALAISVYQIRLSNKQSLFDRRLSIWTVAEELLELYKDNQAQLEKGDEPQFGLEFVFICLTNSSYLHEIGPAVEHPLEIEFQRPFLVKLEELKNLSLKAKFAFKGSSAEVISRFLDSYQRLLFAIYQYQVLMNKAEENSRRFHRDLLQACDAVREPERRKNLYLAYDEASEAYEMLANSDVIRKIEKQIKLVW